MPEHYSELRLRQMEWRSPSFINNNNNNIIIELISMWKCAKVNYFTLLWVLCAWNSEGPAAGRAGNNHHHEKTLSMSKHVVLLLYILDKIKSAAFNILSSFCSCLSALRHSKNQREGDTVEVGVEISTWIIASNFSQLLNSTNWLSN